MKQYTISVSEAFVEGLNAEFIKDLIQDNTGLTPGIDFVVEEGE